jgi:5-methylthioadenosine/S-adenosylhomocysteine deaminase
VSVNPISEGGPGRRETVDLLIRDATVLRMVPDEDPLEHMDIAVHQGAIVGIGPTGTLDVSPIRTLDGRHRAVLPGFVNTHTHLAQVFLRGTTECCGIQSWFTYNRPRVQKLTPEDVLWFSLLGIAEFIRSGVTTFADMFFFEDAVAEAVCQAGLRACLGQGIIDVPGAEANYGPLAKQVSNAVEFATSWEGGARGLISTRLAPHAIYTLSAETLRETAAAAAELRLGVMTHVSETDFEMEFCRERYRTTPVEQFADWGFLQAPFLAAHCIHLSQRDIDILDRPGVGISHNPTSNLKVRTGRADLPALARRRGLAVGLGTDSAASNDQLDLRKEAYVAALVHDWPEGTPAARQCLEMATVQGARAIGLAERIGTIQLGKQADLILIDLDRPHLTPLNDLVRALIYAGGSDDVVSVMVAGKLLLYDGQFLTLDWGRIREEAGRRALRILDES